VCGLEAIEIQLAMLNLQQSTVSSTAQRGSRSQRTTDWGKPCPLPSRMLFPAGEKVERLPQALRLPVGEDLVENSI
jgi:hypothetical protein